MTIYKKWEREGYEILEVDYDYDLHCFEVVKDGEVVTKILTTIYPDSIEQMEEDIRQLDCGLGVDGWEDGNGNLIILE